MQTFWNKVILENTVLQYVIVLAIILLVYLFKKYLGRYTSSLFFLLMRTVGKNLDRQAFVDLIIGPIENFFVVWISYLALRSLQFPNLFDMKMGGIRLSGYTEGVGRFFIIFFLFRMLLRLVDYMALVMGRKALQTPSPDDDQLIVFFKDFVKVILFIFGVLITVKVIFNQDISKVLAGLSIVGAAIALAARESLENLIASFIIFFDKPFTTGDLLKVNNITGNVERIGLRSTRIRTLEKTYVTVPNKQMVDSVVDNLALRTHRRGELKVQVDAKTRADQMEQLVREICVVLHADTIEDYNVQISEITQNAYVIMIDFLSNQVDYKQFNILKDNINLNIIRLIQDLGLHLAGQDNILKIVRGQSSFPTENV